MAFTLRRLADQIAVRKFKNPTVAAHSLRLGGSVAGKIDQCDGTLIRGWVYDVTRPDVVLDLDILVDGEKVHSTTASTYRTDIASLLKDHGVHGFECTVSGLALSSSRERVVKVRLADRPRYFLGPARIEAVNVFAALSSSSTEISQALDDRLAHIFNHITAAHEDGLRRFDVIQEMVSELKRNHHLSSSDGSQSQFESLLYDMPRSAITGVGQFRAPNSFADETALFQARLERALLKVRYGP